MAARGIELSEREAEGAVARDVHDEPLREGRLERERVRQPEAEVRHAGVVEPGARLERARQVVAPERRVAPVVDRERVVRQPTGELACEGGRVDRRDSVVRALEKLGEVRRVRRDERVEPRPVRPRGAVAERLEERGEALAPASPRQDERRRREHPGRRTGVDVEVDHLLRARRPERRGASFPQPRRDAAAGEEHDVGLPQGPQHGLAADQPAVPEERRVGARHGAEPHLRRSRGGAEPRGQATERSAERRRGRPPPPATSSRPLRAREQRGRALDIVAAGGAAPSGSDATVDLRRFDVEGRRARTSAGSSR